MMLELKQHRKRGSSVYAVGNSLRGVFSANRHYNNLDGVGDGNADYLRKVDKTLQEVNEGWRYDYAQERVLLPSDLSSDKIKFSTLTKYGGQVVFDIANGSGVLVPQGMHGYSDVVYKDCPVVGVDMHMVPSRIGLKKYYKIPVSMLPMTIDIPVSGDTELISLDGETWSESHDYVVPQEVRIVTENGQKYIRKEITAPDTTDDYVYTDATLTETNSTTFKWLGNTTGTWPTITQATSAVSSDNAAATMYARVRGGASPFVYRSFLNFETGTALDGMTVDSASIRMVLHSTYGTLNDNQRTYLVTGALTTPATIALTDFYHVDHLGNPYTALSANDYLLAAPHYLAGDTAGVEGNTVIHSTAAIDTTGNDTWFAIVAGYDVTQTTPSSAINGRMYYGSSDAAKYPELTVNYHAQKSAKTPVYKSPRYTSKRYSAPVYSSRGQVVTRTQFTDGFESATWANNWELVIGSLSRETPQIGPNAGSYNLTHDLTGSTGLIGSTPSFMNFGQPITVGEVSTRAVLAAGPTGQTNITMRFRNGLSYGYVFALNFTSASIGWVVARVDSGGSTTLGSGALADTVTDTLRMRLTVTDNATEPQVKAEYAPMATPTTFGTLHDAADAGGSELFPIAFADPAGVFTQLTAGSAAGGDELQIDDVLFSV